MLGQPDRIVFDPDGCQLDLPNWQLGIRIQVRSESQNKPELTHRWRGNKHSLMLSLLKMTPWFRELQAHLRSSIDGSSEVKYYHK
jgi:hypothetical protein